MNTAANDSTQTINQMQALRLATSVSKDGSMDEYVPLTYQLRKHIGTDPEKRGIPTVEDYEHATFQSNPYFAFIDDPDPSHPDGLLLVSDLGFRGRLAYVSSSGLSLTFSVTPIGPCVAELEAAPKPADYSQIELTWNPEGLSPGTHGFVITGTPVDDPLLPSSSPSRNDADYCYVVNTPKGEVEEKQNAQTLGSNFTGKIFAFSSLLRLFNIKVFDPDNMQNTTSAAAKQDPDLKNIKANQFVFDLPPGNSKDYNGMNKEPVPWGWKFLTESEGHGKETSRSLQTQADVTNSSMRSSGFNVKASASVNAGPVSAKASFSTSRNKSLEKKAESMHASESVQTESREVNLWGSLVLDKRNVRLHEGTAGGAGFAQRIQELAGQCTEDDFEQVTLPNFFNDWGTHFLNAASFGSTKYSTETVSATEIKEMKAANRKYESAWDASAEVKVQGPGVGGGASVEGGQKHGDDLGLEKQHSQKRGNTTKTWTTIGDIASGAMVPVYGDLRPISELLGPPLFTDPAVVVTLRDKVAKGIDDYGFKIVDPDKDEYAKPPLAAYRFHVTSDVNIYGTSSQGEDVGKSGDFVKWWDGYKKKGQLDPVFGPNVVNVVLYQKNLVAEAPLGSEGLNYTKGYDATKVDVVGIPGGPEGDSFTLVLSNTPGPVTFTSWIFAGDEATALFPDACLTLPFKPNPSRDGYQMPADAPIPFEHKIDLTSTEPQTVGYPGGTGWIVPRKSPGSDDQWSNGKSDHYYGFWAYCEASVTVTVEKVDMDELIGL